MYFIYVGFVILSFVISYYIYKRVFNPIIVYGMIWLSALILYKTNLVIFTPLSDYTILVILLVHIVFTGGNLLGFLFSKVKFLNWCPRTKLEKKRLLEKAIIFSGLLASIDIVYKFILTVLINGINIYSNVSRLYNNELYSTRASHISFSAFLFVSVTFSGIYISLYGIRKRILFPIFIAILQQLSNGSRGGLVSIFLMFIASFFVQTNKKEVLNKKTKKIVFIIVGSMIFLIAFVTSARLKHSSISYASDTLNKLPIFSSLIAKAIEYISSGIACLNQFLIDPVRNKTAQTFFRVPFIFLNKIGITSIDTKYKSLVYAIPFPSNVITYIGELYRDFGNGLYFVIFFLSSLFSMFFCKAVKNEDITCRTLFSVFFVIFSLSFFVYFGRLANVWYVLVIGGIWALYIDYQIH